MEDPISKLSEYFSKFPGIGSRQAKRFAYFILSGNDKYAKELSALIVSARENVAQCSECFRFFSINSNNQRKECSICVNPNVDKSTLMVVEKDADLESVMKSRFYDGRYFVLGSLAPIIDKDSSSNIRLRELLSLTEKRAKQEELKEIILAFSASPQGEHTDIYLRGKLENLEQQFNLKISTLGRGLSTGTELEYSDNETLKNALKNRQ